MATAFLIDAACKCRYISYHYFVFYILDLNTDSQKQGFITNKITIKISYLIANGGKKSNQSDFLVILLSFSYSLFKTMYIYYMFA